MSNRPLDVSRWNLFSLVSRAGTVALLAACGPVVGTDTNTSGDTDDDTQPTNPTDPSDPTVAESSFTTNPTGVPECYTDAECPSGHECVSGYCQYDDYCDSVGCCYYVEAPPGFDIRCSPPLDCYSDSECDYGEQCIYGDCEPLPVCPSDIPIVEVAYDVVFSGAGGAIGAIASGNVVSNDGTELLVARGSDVELVVNGLGVVAMTASAPIVAMATGDVDGDAQIDVITATDAEVQVWLNDAGAFSSLAAIPLFGTTALALGDRTGDGTIDLFALAGAYVVQFPGQGGGAFGASETLATGDLSALAVLDAQGDGASEVLWSSGSTLWMSSLDGAPIDVGYTESTFVRDLAVGDFDGDAAVDVSMVGDGPSAMSTIRGELGAGWGSYVTPIDQLVYDAATGDMDGDGRADLALALDGTGLVRVRFGAEGIPSDVGPTEPFGCTGDYGAGITVTRVALVDLAGDGLADIVTSDGGTVRVLVVGI
jgi:hypothetical protein